MTRTPPPSPRRPVPTPLPNAGRASFAVFAVLFAITADAAHVALYGYFLTAWGTIEDTTTLEHVEGLVSMAQMLSLIVGAVGFIRWFRRAYGNAIALGHRASYTPGWAIGGWFVPLVNLVRPYQIASAMWRHAGARVSPGALVGWWWTFWLAGNLLAQFGMRLSGSPSNDTVRLGVQLLLASDVASVIAGVLAVRMVRRLTQAHASMVPESAASVFA